MVFAPHSPHPHALGVVGHDAVVFGRHDAVVVLLRRSRFLPACASKMKPLSSESLLGKGARARGGLNLENHCCKSLILCNKSKCCKDLVWFISELRS